MVVECLLSLLWLVDELGLSPWVGTRISVRVTRKVGHPCRLWELDETYHAVS